MKFPILVLSTLAVSYLGMAVTAANDVAISDNKERSPALRGNKGDDNEAQRELSSPVLATFYEHFYFQGRSITVTHPGYYGIDFLFKAHFNDIISSVKVAPGYAVKLCIDDGCYNPHDLLIAGSIDRFGYLNDQVSSFIVYQPAAILYEDAHYSGRGLVVLEPGHFNIDFFYQNHFNDLASSMIVAPGFQVLLCLHAHFVECKHEADVGNIPWFGHINDQVSSIIVSPTHYY